MKERYENLDGLRAYACIGIIMMHVRANGNYEISGFFYDQVIASFTNFTYLFMLLSAFSMCCGYYTRFKSGNIDIESFYRRRIRRVWPFFAFLCTFEMIIEHSLNSVFEWFADLTLVFGLLPKNEITIVGVGWFLGTIFVFYFLFPFFVFILGNKKRAWFSFAISIVLHILCMIRFIDAAGRSNIVFSSIFFIAGGLIYLYRVKITQFNKPLKIATYIGLAIGVVTYYLINGSTFILLIVFSVICILAISSKGTLSRIALQNKATRFAAGISMEVYLCHMFVYRVIEKGRLLHMTGNEIMNYIIVCFITICGAIVMSLVLNKIIAFVGNKLQKA